MGSSLISLTRRQGLTSMWLDNFEFSPRDKRFKEVCCWPVIDALFAFLDKEMEMLAGNTIEAPQMTIRLVPEVLDPVDMVSGFDKFLRVINALMSKTGDIRSIIAQKAISIDNAVWLDCLSNDRNQCILSGIRNDNDVDLTASPEQSEYWRFARSAASALPFPGATKVAFINFNLS